MPAIRNVEVKLKQKNGRQLSKRSQWTIFVQNPVWCLHNHRTQKRIKGTVKRRTIYKQLSSLEEISLCNVFNKCESICNICNVRDCVYWSQSRSHNRTSSKCIFNRKMCVRCFTWNQLLRFVCYRPIYSFDSYIFFDGFFHLFRSTLLFDGFCVAHFTQNALEIFEIVINTYGFSLEYRTHTASIQMLNKHFYFRSSQCAYVDKMNVLFHLRFYSNNPIRPIKLSFLNSLVSFGWSVGRLKVFISIVLNVAMFWLRAQQYLSILKRFRALFNAKQKIFKTFHQI